jgi:hypothetical protein
MNDRQAIELIHREFPNAPELVLQANCNPAFLILRVLHRFQVHPHLAALEESNWTGIKGWSRLERLLGH